ncbi:MAG: hypothetical protein JNL73_00195 [Anaerolineales bacterium]|nr:hypothetical protein [Anaerolineales bacterium]
MPFIPSSSQIWRLVALGALALNWAACAGPDLAPSSGPQTPTLTPQPTAAPTSVALASAQALPTPTPIGEPADGRPLFLVHYMPWYQTPSVSGVWGWHWTMGHFNPNNVAADGRAEIASHLYPLTGPYDSRDADVLAYQMALMKLSGIDGVIVDWYGFEPYRDYALLNAGTHKLFEAVTRAGLLFAICFEDRSIGARVSDGLVRPSRALAEGREVMAYLGEKWLSSPYYLKREGRPVLFVFGNPPYFDTADDWEVLFAELEPKPWLVTEDDPVSEAEPARYPWPPMGLSQGGALTRAALGQYLTDFYAGTAADPLRVAGAFPGFQDIYAEAGVGSSYGSLDPEAGGTLQYTLGLALASNPDLVQLITWNDYGEGTSLEPTREVGYRYLEIIQEARRAAFDPDLVYTPEDLTLPMQWLALRRDRRADPSAQAALDAVYGALVSGELDLARALLTELSP